MEKSEKIFGNLNVIFENVKEISNEAPELGKILLFNFKQAFDIYEAFIKNESYDISEQINFISDLLHIDLYQLIKDSTTNQQPADVNEDITQFILDNAKVVNDNIDKYESFIKNTLKEINGKIDG